MGLNDAFMIDDSAETPPSTPTVNALKDTVPGQMPEELDDVTLIAVEDEPEANGTETNEEETIRVATEELHVRIRDLNLLHETLVSTKGMNQAIALECQHTLPNFVGDVRPMGSFTSSLTKVHYQAALEEVDNEKKGVLQKIKAFVQDLIKSLIDRVKRFFGKATPAEVKEKVRETPSMVQRMLSDYEKIHKEEKYRNITTKQLAVEMRKVINRNSLVHIQLGGNEKYTKLIDDFVAAAEGVMADTFLSGNEDKDEFFTEAEKMISEITQEAVVLGEDEDGLYKDCAESLYSRGDRLYGSHALSQLLNLARITDGLEATLDKAIKNVAVSETSELVKTIQKRITLASRYLTMAAQINGGYLTYFKYYKVGKFIAVAEQAALRQLAADKVLASAKDPAAGLEAFQGDGVSPNGAISPLANYTPGGFAEYFFEVKGAAELHGSLNGEGSINSDPKKELVARIRTLQEALARLEANETPSMESIDFVANTMLPKDALTFTMAASRGNVDKNAFKSALARDAAPILSDFKGRLSDLGLQVAGARKAMGELSKFGFFSAKAAPREVRDSDIAEWKKLANADTCSVHAWCGMPENTKMVMAFIREAVDLAKTDVFVPRSWWSQMDWVNKSGKNFLTRYNSEAVDDHDKTAKLVVSGIFGQIPGFFNNAEDTFKTVERCFESMNGFVENDLKRYIAVCEEKDYQSDLAYFNDVLGAAEWTVRVLIWVASAFYTYITNRKKFLVMVA